MEVFAALFEEDNGKGPQEGAEQGEGLPEIGEVYGHNTFCRMAEFYFSG